MRAYPHDTTPRGLLSRAVHRVQALNWETMREAAQGVNRESMRDAYRRFLDGLADGDLADALPWLARRRAARPSWQRVPKINLLTTRQHTWSRTTYLRLGLATLVLISASLAWNANRALNSSWEEVARLDGRLTDLVRSRSALEADVEDIEVQIEEIVGGQQVLLEPLHQVEAARRQWEAAFINLFGVRLGSVTLDDVEASPDGTVVARGTAPDVTSMRDFQAQLRSLQGPVELESLTWSTGKVPGLGVEQNEVDFRAFFAVAPEAAPEVEGE